LGKESVLFNKKQLLSFCNIETSKRGKLEGALEFDL
jgi:hypothetical protein